MEIEDNIKRIRENIARAALRGGHDANVTLMAVTKTVAPESIIRALDCGIDVIGENRAQELLSKYDALKGRCAMHFIGHLQTNKVASIIDKVDMVQSLDSPHLAAELDRRAAAAGRTLDVLIQVNTGAEENKSGFLFEETASFAAQAKCYPHLHIRGLMAVAPVNAGIYGGTGALFEKMFKLFVDIRQKKHDNIDMDILSMGMTHDYETAVEHGANLVRVGSGIFGDRNY